MGPLTIAIFASGILFALGEMGFLTSGINSLVSFLLTSGFIILNRPRRCPVAISRLAGAISLLALAIVFARAGSLWLFLTFIAIPAALYLMLEDAEHSREMELLIPTVTMFMFLWAGLRWIPHLWWVADAAAVKFSGFVGKLIGQDYVFSSTASGFHVVAFFACWGISRFLLANNRTWDLLRFLFFLIVTAGIVQILLTPLAMIVQRWAGDLDFLLFNPQIIYLVAATLPVAWYRRKSPLSTPQGRHHLGRKVRAKVATIVAVLAGLCLGIAFTLTAPNEGGGGKIILLDKGYLDWRVPVFGYYGHRSGGMFGRLPQWLEAQGYEVTKEPGPLNSAILSDASVLVIINLMEFLEPEVKQAIWRFVKHGGSLLVLGDHTGVKGIRLPFNDLLRPFNIEFEFDSATFWSQGWRDALELMPHPINRDVIVAEDIQIWIGASLAIAPPARPVIIGKYAYSDIGDAAKIDRSFLGDRRYNLGERLGNVCLVAEASYGKGKVLAFGDTSPFQNGALTTSWKFAQRVFQWLSGKPRFSARPYRGIAIFVAALLIFCLRRFLSLSFHGWGFLSLGFVIAAQLIHTLAAPPPLPRIAQPKALVDISHAERFDQLSWYDNCIGGLELNLARNGYSPMLMRDFSGSLVEDSDVLIVIAPAKDFSPQECQTISNFMKDGGTLILSTGYEERDRSRALLSLFSTEILPVPLAYFETRVWDQTVRLAEAWPIKVSAPGTIPICYYSGLDYPVIAYAPRGRGGALLIGDSRFFLNSNLEGKEEYYLGNITFLKAFFDSLKAGAFHR